MLLLIFSTLLFSLVSEIGRGPSVQRQDLAFGGRLEVRAFVLRRLLGKEVRVYIQFFCVLFIRLFGLGFRAACMVPVCVVLLCVQSLWVWRWCAAFVRGICGGGVALLLR